MSKRRLRVDLVKKLRRVVQGQSAHAARFRDAEREVESDARMKSLVGSSKITASDMRGLRHA